jgi:cytochrome b561
MIETVKYNLTMRIMHWVVGLIIICLLGVGLYMTSLPDDHPNKWNFYNLHKSFGVTVLALILLRLLIRVCSIIPSLPEKISSVEKNLSKVGILIIYICMLVMPFSGYISSDAGGHGVKWFGYAMPNFFLEKNIELSSLAITIHIYVAYFLITLLLLHVFAPIKHLIVDKVNIYKRIV